MKLVFTWIQGCGKGTQARLLIEKYGFKLIEMGGALRDIAKENSELWNIVKSTIDAGHQVSPEIVGEVIKSVILNETDENVIYDGFVRNMGNKETMDSVLSNYTVVFFNLSKEKSMGRLLGRMYDPISGETFISTMTHNPKTGTALIKRADDNEAAILTRINAFVDYTLPVVEAQKKEWKVVEINADQSIESVFAEIESKLGLN